MLSSLYFPSSLSSVNVSGNAMAPPPCRVRSSPMVAFATATATATATSAADARSTWTDQPRSSSYVNPSCMSSASLYDILGIPASASNQEIKAAYRRLARVCHPDVAEIGQKTSSADEFMQIHAAYSTLSDPEKRASYDRSLFRSRQRPLSAASVFSGYTGRNWETDQCW
ncbi:hypothetical protein TanjilG_22042 [Lupinus angustifolius]|uniref:J domain-containing protein n=1 Tax=Lupinus angustifolius TaxID=3871 RepID=A0A4P1QTX4_LUPAN|nr:PREDICTED: chaperone protein dnaJ 11, chloroplastic-like [Lupinus angustifolius]OIV94845.1 hypothetical protein TanjilG_22042 [Lupinus angustifolius]